ncbi:MAG: type II toxin-antitoxin system VapC family toxin, partial [Candidatus Limnocylindrales bacterium]
MSYLLDTTVAIDWSHAVPSAVDVVQRLFAETDRLYTTDVIVCEALSGGTAQERDVIERFLGALEHVSLGPEGARAAGELRRSAGRAGPRSLADTLIAALALQLDATIVTR